MAYINGSVDDRADDILPDKDLFNILCNIIYICEDRSALDIDYLDKVIETQIEKVKVSDIVSAKKLKTALRAMVLAFISTQMRDMAQKAFMQLM